MKKRTKLALGTLAAGALTLGAAALTPSAAYACGGFFCNNQPIEQSGEEIIFAVEPEIERVRAIIRISYSGEAPDFAWVLPVSPGLTVEEIGTSSEDVFRRVRNLTNPRFELEWLNPENTCLPYGPGEFAFDANASAGGGPPQAAEGGVQVLDSGQVGPYEVAILASDNAAELVEWLNTHGFVQPPESTPLIGHYLNQDMNFVALKLQQDKGSGDIKPVVLDLEQDEACVPIVLTQIAASPDMPIRLFVLGDARAVPTNWFHVGINYKKLDWMNVSWNQTISNYTEVVTEAINEAEGHGFVTEYAGTTDIVAGLLYSPEAYDLASLASTTGAAAWVMALQGMFTGTPELLAILKEFVPMPSEGLDEWVTEQDFYNCPDCYSDAYASIDFDAQAATAAVEQRIVMPLRDAQELFDQFPYMTRLMTFVSPEEMTRDPMFDFNPALADVPNLHKATGMVTCNGSEVTEILLTLPDGTAMYTSLPDWWGQQPSGQVDDTSAEPFAATVELLAPEGQAVEVPKTLLEYFDKQLALKEPHTVFTEANEIVGNPAGGNTPNGTDGGDGSSPGGCNSSAGSPWMMWSWLALALGAWGVRRNRG